MKILGNDGEYEINIISALLLYHFNPILMEVWGDLQLFPQAARENFISISSIFTILAHKSFIFLQTVESYQSMDGNWSNWNISLQ